MQWECGKDKNERRKLYKPKCSPQFENQKFMNQLSELCDILFALKYEGYFRNMISISVVKKWAGLRDKKMCPTSASCRLQTALKTYAYVETSVARVKIKHHSKA